MNDPTKPATEAQQLPEAAVEAAAKAVIDANTHDIRWADLPEEGEAFGLSRAATRRSVQVVLQAFLSKATGPDLLSLAAERMGDGEREELRSRVAHDLRTDQVNMGLTVPKDWRYQLKLADAVLAALFGERDA